MCRRLVFASVALALAGGSSSVRADLFDFGSDGSFGAIVVLSGSTFTLNLPPDGIFNATTVTVASGGTLKFNRNALNTPVYLLATGDVLIQGTIDVSGSVGTSNPPVGGRGGPGGFDGGMPGFGPGVSPGAGHGPGAGLGGLNQNAIGGAGLAAYGPVNCCDRATNGHEYGSPSLIPLLGGSGGGGTAGQPGIGGMGGGGAILIASNTRVDIPSPGRVLANGGNGGCNVNEGSGGAIRLLAPVVAGNGLIQVGSGNCNTGGFGRIRVDSIDRSALQLAFSPNTSTTSVGSTMFAFPDAVPTLAIIQAAGQAIPEGTPDPVTVLLPFGSTSSRTVTVRARHFTGIVPIDVVLTPDNGDRTVYPAEINMGQGDPAQVIVNVEVPINSATRVEVWTR
ncbi:MAG: hypothetical protein HY287_02795 [Planctomycetes bacterium]|nr:hypothetical protein [Planctomycetota bacterium]MBI3833239.1 hypothetical protein [Planctomycetota bacterium]